MKLRTTNPVPAPPPVPYLPTPRTFPIKYIGNNKSGSASRLSAPHPGVSPRPVSLYLLQTNNSAAGPVFVKPGGHSSSERLYCVPDITVSYLRPCIATRTAHYVTLATDVNPGDTGLEAR